MDGNNPRVGKHTQKAREIVAIGDQIGVFFLFMKAKLDNLN